MKVEPVLVKCQTCWHVQRVTPSFVDIENENITVYWGSRFSHCDICDGMTVLTNQADLAAEEKWKKRFLNSQNGEKKMELHSEILEMLIASESDFMRQRAIVAATKSTRHQVAAALFKLRTEGRAGLIIAPDGTGWWYHL